MRKAGEFCSRRQDSVVPSAHANQFALEETWLPKPAKYCGYNTEVFVVLVRLVRAEQQPQAEARRAAANADFVGF